MLHRLYRSVSIKTLGVYLAIGLLAWTLTACGDRLVTSGRATPDSRALPVARGKLSEVAPPPLIRELRRSLERYQPRVTILSPTPDQLFPDTKVKVELQVTDLPVFRDPDLALGPYLALILDNEPVREIHDLSGPVALEDLGPGTHTLRVFACRPWHESFKNEGAYARTTFHVITKTGFHEPDPELPLLTYNRPQGIYGAQPILLDFYLDNAPLHLVAREDENDEIEDWRVRVTAGSESFLLDTWEPIYLQGFEKGDNLIKLEFIDEKGDPVENVFNTTARLFSYDPAYEDSLTRLVRGDLPESVARKIVDPDYRATPVIEESPASAAGPVPPETTPENKPEAIEGPVGETIPEAIELPRLAIPEEKEESPAPRLPVVVIPPATDITETPASETIDPPRPVPPEEVETLAPETPTPEPEKRGGLLDRLRDTLSRRRSPADSGATPPPLPVLKEKIGGKTEIPKEVGGNLDDFGN